MIIGRRALRRVLQLHDLRLAVFAALLSGSVRAVRQSKLTLLTGGKPIVEMRAVLAQSARTARIIVERRVRRI